MSVDSKPNFRIGERGHMCVGCLVASQSHDGCVRDGTLRIAPYDPTRLARRDSRATTQDQVLSADAVVSSPTSYSEVF